MATMASVARAPQILSCWKEIADHFGKGVRTVQRWESLGMPVHRPSSNRNIVFAYPEELERWVLRDKGRRNAPFERCERLIRDARLIAAQTRKLITESRELLARQSATASAWYDAAAIAVSRSREVSGLTSSERAASNCSVTGILADAKSVRFGSAAMD